MNFFNVVFITEAEAHNVSDENDQMHLGAFIVAAALSLVVGYQDEKTK